MEKAAAATTVESARPTATETDSNAAMEKAARMERAAKLQAQRDGVRRRREEYLRWRGLSSIPNSILVDETNNHAIDNINVDTLLGLNRYGSSYQSSLSNYV